MMVDGIGSGDGSVPREKNTAEGARLERACVEFESLFISHLVKSMRASLGQGGLFGNSHGSQVLTAMFDEKLALEMSESGGIGLAQMFLDHLKE